jgi:hypothetical protein
MVDALIAHGATAVMAVPEKGRGSHMRRLGFGLLSAAILALLTSPASALTLEGILEVNGGVRVDQTTIDFTPLGGGEGLQNIPGPGVSTFEVNGVLAVNCSNCVVAQDLSQLDQPVNPTEENPFQIVDFYEQLLQFPTLNFQLQDILSCGELGGLVCALGDASAFGFTQTVLGTTVTFGTAGQVFMAGDPDVYSFTALYTAQFTGQTIAQVLSAFAAGGPGYIDASFSATKITVFENPIPEPATLLLLGTGLVGAAARARRRKNTSV